MPADFDEKSGLVWAVTDWGRWCQTVRGIIIQVNVQDPAESASHSPPIRSKEIKVDVSAKKVKCAVRDKVIFEVGLKARS